MRIARHAVPLALVASLSSGCFGSFRLTNAVYEFNRDVSDEIVVQEIVFLAFVIVPVYGVAALADAWVFNIIEFATGNNPLASRLPAPGESHLVQLDDGGSLLVSREGPGLQLVVSRPGQPDEVHTVERRREAVRLIDSLGRQVAAARPAPDGGVAVVDGDGVVLAAHSRDEVWRASEAWAAEGSSGLARQLTAPGVGVTSR